MYAFEKEIAKLEAIETAVSYPYQVIPLSEQAKLHFGLFNRERGPLEKMKDFFKRNLTEEKLQRFPFKGNMSFFYDETNETLRIGEVKDLVKWNMARFGIPGINYKGKDAHYISYMVAISEGTDYKIEIGKKVVHEKPVRLTFDDVKTL